MPQNTSYDNIFLNSKSIMSTILTHRQPEPSKILVDSIPVKKGEKLVTKQSPMQFTCEDLIGLTWVLFDKGDEI
ncbi:MAG: hypothetical protein K8Q89_00970 [Nitrosarchaeum sp.]|nr:hypothetical protein [Nitrosarchaeum sp.]